MFFSPSCGISSTLNVSCHLFNLFSNVSMYQFLNLVDVSDSEVNDLKS
jgi:hypothetical protein